MKNILSKVWRFIVLSSADPKRSSLALRGFGLMAITMFVSDIVPTIRVVCELGYLCEFVEPSFVETLNELLDVATTIVYYALLTISAAFAFVGTLRKLHRSFRGENLALHNPDSVK